MASLTQIYIPVTHSNGQKLVQVTNPDGAFCGWADGRGKYDMAGTWTIDDAWSPSQAAELASVLAGLRAVARVTVATDGVARRVTCEL